MTLSQLYYIVAVDNFRHFSTAAEYSFVTQPTLSMQIQKLEEELGIIIAIEIIKMVPKNLLSKENSLIV